MQCLKFHTLHRLRISEELSCTMVLPNETHGWGREKSASINVYPGLMNPTVHWGCFPLKIVIGCDMSWYITIEIDTTPCWVVNRYPRKLWSLNGPPSHGTLPMCGWWSWWWLLFLLLLDLSVLIIVIMLMMIIMIIINGRSWWWLLLLLLLLDYY